MRQRKVILGLMLIGVLYCAGYAACRVTGSITHYSSYRTDAGHKVVAEHRVRVGGMADVASPPQNAIPALLYTPLRLLEQAAWYVINPPGSSWDGT